MKYLKSYKLFESLDTDDLVQDVRDMLLELSDMDLTASCEHYPEKQMPSYVRREYISVGLEKELSDIPRLDSQLDIRWLDVNEVINRVLDFMSMSGWKPSYIILDGESHQVELKDAKDFLSNKFNHFSTMKQRLCRREIAAVFSTLQIDFVRVENISESLDFNKRKEITDVLSDMSLELWDSNFNVQVSVEELTQSDKFIRVVVQKRGRNLFFNWSDVSDTIETMTSYLISEGLQFGSFTIEVVEDSGDNSYYLKSRDEVDEFFFQFSGNILQIRFRFRY